MRAGMTGAYSFKRPCRLGLACAAAFMSFVGNGAGEGSGRGWRMSAAPYAAAAEARSCASWPRKSMNLPSSAAVAAFALQGATPLSSRLLLLVQGLSDVNCNLEAASHGKAIIQSGDALPPSRSPSGMSLRMMDSPKASASPPAQARAMQGSSRARPASMTWGGMPHAFCAH